MASTDQIKIRGVKVTDEILTNPNQWNYYRVDQVILGVKTIRDRGWEILSGGNLTKALRVLLPKDDFSILVTDPEQCWRFLKGLPDKVKNKSLEEVRTDLDEAILKVAREESIKGESKVEVARIEALVEEYEAYLEKHKGKREEAWREMEKRYGGEIRGFIENQKKVYRETVKELAELGIEKEKAEKIVDSIAGEILIAKEKGRDESIQEQIIEKVAREEFLTDEKLGDIAERINEKIVVIKAERGLEGLAKTLVDDMSRANIDPKNPAVTIISPIIFEQKQREILEEKVFRVLQKVMIDGEITAEKVVVEGRKEEIDLSGFKMVIENQTDKIKAIGEKYPELANYKLEKELVWETIKANPEISIEKAVSYAKFVVASCSPENASINRLDRSGMVKEVGTGAAEKAALDNLTVMSWALRQSPEKWAVIRRNYEENFDSVAKPLNNDQARSLNSFMSLVKNNPGVADLLHKAQAVNQAKRTAIGVVEKVLPKKYAGVITKILRLDSALMRVKEMGVVKKIVQMGSGSTLGRAVVALAKGGFGVETVSSFLVGSIWKGGLKGGLTALGKKVAGTAIGKMVIGIGARLGIKALVGAASGPIGWVVGGLMMIPDLVKLAKVPFDKFREILGSFGLDFIGGAKKVLQDMGIEGLLATILAGAGAVMTGVLALPARLGAVVFGPTIMVGVIGFFVLISAHTVLQNNLISTMVPAKDIGGGGDAGFIRANPNNKDVGYIGPIPEGCPNGFPTNFGRITQGPNTTGTHRGSLRESIDIGVGVGTRILATHDGGVNCIHDTTGYGWMVDLQGQCAPTDGGAKIMFYTRYGHMSTFNEAVCGRQVKKGDLIGLSGGEPGQAGSGNTTGPHVHYEIVRAVLGSINKYLPEGSRVRNGCGIDPQPSCGVSF